MTSTTLAWILTYALHALFLAGLALVVVDRTRLAGSCAASRVIALRVGLFGPLLTSLVAVAIPPGSDASLAPLHGVADVRAIGLFTDGAPTPFTDRPSGSGPASHPPRDPAGTWERTRPGPRAHASGPAVPTPLGRAVLMLTAAAALVGLARLARREAMARHALARRRRLAPDELASPGLARRGVHVSVCRGIASPLALGAHEVVVPHGLLESLAPDEREALFAHEFAHLARRDPLWLGAARWLVAATWILPLGHRLLRRMEHETELAADARAVEVTRRPVALARCLERACAWQRSMITPAIAAGMGHPGHPLVQRVEALCAMPPVRDRSRAKRVAAVSTAVLALVACAGPAVTTGADAAAEIAAESGVWGPDGPFRRTPYTGPDAEPGEQRFWLTLASTGGLARLPTEGIVSSTDVLDVLRRGMRQGTVPVGLGAGSMAVLADRVVVEVPGDVPFTYVLAWFGNFARDGVRAYRTEVALAPATDADVVSIFLPTSSADVPIEEVPEANATPPSIASDRAELRIHGPDGVWDLRLEGGVEIRTDPQASGFPMSDLNLRGPLVVVVDPDVPAKHVIPVLRELVAGGVELVFQGVIIEPPIRGRGDAEGR